MHLLSVPFCELENQVRKISLHVDKGKDDKNNTTLRTKKKILINYIVFNSNNKNRFILLPSALSHNLKKEDIDILISYCSVLNY